jgi:hypothetical protein
MRISEIILTPEREGDLQSYATYLSSDTGTPAFEDLLYVNAVDGEDHYFGLINKEGMLATFLWVQLRENNYHQIVYSQTAKEYRRRGCFRYCLEKATSKYGTILSDDRQTPQAAHAWGALIEFPGSKIKIMIFDTQSKKFHETTDKDYVSVWSNPQLLLAAVKIQYSNSAKELYKISEARKASTGRTYNDLFFGINSSNNDYSNP